MYWNDGNERREYCMTSHLFQTYGRRTIEFVKGTGTKVIDNNGKEYLDFTSGIGVCNLGHCHPTVLKVYKSNLMIYGIYLTCLQTAYKKKLRHY